MNHLLHGFLAVLGVVVLGVECPPPAAEQPAEEETGLYPHSLDIPYGLAHLIATGPTWPLVSPLDAQKRPDTLSPREWQNALRISYVLQQHDADTVELAFILYHALNATCEEFSAPEPGDSRPLLLTRLMFVVPDDAMPGDGARPSYVRPFDGLSAVGAVAGEPAAGTLASPIRWGNAGPELTAFGLEGGNLAASEPHRVYRFFHDNFRSRWLLPFIHTDDPAWNDLVRRGFLPADHWHFDVDESLESDGP